MMKPEFDALLKKLGLRQVDVAWMMNVSGNRVCTWGRKNPVPQAAVLLLRALETGRITPTWLRRQIPFPIPYNRDEWK